MESKKRKIGYRSRYRSTKEMDLILRQFWEKFGNNLSDEELDIYEHFINEDDFILYKWITNVVDSPLEYNSLISTIRKEIGKNFFQ